MKKQIAHSFSYVFFIVAIILTIWKWYLENNNMKETAGIVENLVLGVMTAAVFLRFLPSIIPKWFSDTSGKDLRDKHIEKKNQE